MIKKFENWFISNKLFDKNKRLSLDKKHYLSFNEIVKVLEEIESKINMINNIDINLINNIDYSKAKLISNLLKANRKQFKKNEYSLYSEIMNYYLKYILTTYVKKNDLNRIIKNYKAADVDISNISLLSNMIYEELAKWPYMYALVDENNEYVTTNIKKDNYQMKCIPIYSSKELITENQYRIKKVKLNLFLEKLDKEIDNHAVGVVINPSYNWFINVFIDFNESFWYYYPDISVYF